MVYPNNFEEKIGFSKIKDPLRSLCISEMGNHYIDRMSFSSNSETILKQIQQTHEMKDILSFHGGIPQQDYYDLRPCLKRLEIERTFIDLEELAKLHASLKIVSTILSFMKNREEQFPTLHLIIENLDFNQNIITKASQIIDENGKIKNNASPALEKIRSLLFNKRLNVDNTLHKTLQEVKKEGWAAADAMPTIRNGRSVIPVPATFKRQIKGFIHDASATGQTVYIEPTIIFELNNSIRELENDERIEIVNILTTFTQYIRPDIPVLSKVYQYLGLIDFIMAKAKYAQLTGSNMPKLSATPHIYLEEAYHPLLYLTLQKQKKPIVPLNLKLDDKERILVISGPNAGGKSVCLKTIGLIQYMFQCGLLIPARESSTLGIFKDIFINIGDEQSLENDLSTYSSHLKHLNVFIRKISSQSLFLIDEFGSGTEPQIGGVIAEAVLEALNKKSPFGVITTHYANLKKLVDEQPGMVNGAMLFDINHMRPLYILKMGSPGSSFAFEIAEKIGIPRNILANAEKKTNKSQINFDKQLQQLDVEKHALKEKNLELKALESFLSETMEKYNTLLSHLENRKNEILRTAREEAKGIVLKSNKIIENTIREIQESKADRVIVKKARTQLEEQKENIIKAVESKERIEKNDATPKEITVGSFVKMKETDTVGHVLKKDKDKIVIAFESFRFSTTVQQVELIDKPKGVKIPKSHSSGHYRIMDSINKKAAHFNYRLDIRGKKAEEAYLMAKKYLDEALLIGISEVEIIHGKGDGVLASVIREVLTDTPQIKSWDYQHADFGGTGITVVKLR